MTAAPGRLYLHVFEWPDGGALRVPGLTAPVTGAWLLGDPARTPLSVTHEVDAVKLVGPADAPDPIDSVVVLTLG